MNKSLYKESSIFNEEARARHNILYYFSVRPGSDESRVELLLQWRRRRGKHLLVMTSTRLRVCCTAVKAKYCHLQGLL